MGTMKDTPEASELRRRAEKKLAIEAGSTELLSEMNPERMQGLRIASQRREICEDLHQR